MALLDMAEDSMAGAGARIMARCDELRLFSASSNAYTRLYLTTEHRAAANRLTSWMREAGASVRMDAVGNLIGRIEGTDPDAPALVLGSHFDTVRDAGGFDGILGVVTAIEVAAGLTSERHKLPFPLELHAYADEEGVRFHSMLLGSGFVTGLMGTNDLDRVDSDGNSLSKALRDFGLNPADVGTARRNPEEFRAYLELHIEQGPVLERMGKPVAAVTAIAGQTRGAVTAFGTAGHAGTVPMGMRRDALAASAEAALAVERIARESKDDLVATIGEMRVLPGASNVIPGEVSFTLDLRSGDDEKRRAALDTVRSSLRAIAEQRNMAIELTVDSETPATVCDRDLVTAIDAACQQVQDGSPHLVSGAGHDAIALSTLCPVGMIFVRCKGGVSHNPAESITEADADSGYRAFHGAVRNIMGLK